MTITYLIEKYFMYRDWIIDSGANILLELESEVIKPWYIALVRLKKYFILFNINNSF